MLPLGFPTRKETPRDESKSGKCHVTLDDSVIFFLRPCFFLEPL